jgi:hypothetical protein
MAGQMPNIVAAKSKLSVRLKILCFCGYIDLEFSFPIFLVSQSVALQTCDINKIPSER